MSMAMFQESGLKVRRGTGMRYLCGGRDVLRFVQETSRLGVALCLSVSLSVSVSLSLCSCLSISLFLSLSLYLFLSLSLCLRPCVCVSLSVSVCLSVSLSWSSIQRKPHSMTIATRQKHQLLPLSLDLLLHGV